MDPFVLQIFLVIVIFLWGFRRILAKIGWSPAWAWFFLVPILGLFTPATTRPFLFVVFPLILAAILFWVVAFVRWPRFELDPNAITEGYDPPDPRRFSKRFRREQGPVATTREQGVSRRPRRRDSGESSE